MPSISSKEDMLQSLMKERKITDAQKEMVVSVIEYLRMNSEKNNKLDIEYEINCLCDCIGDSQLFL